MSLFSNGQAEPVARSTGPCPESIPLEDAIRMNIGCGSCVNPGWLNIDLCQANGVDLIGDVTQGLPLPDAMCDYIVGIHVLQDIPYPDMLPALNELRRLLKFDGVLRLGLPDLDRALQAYLRKDHRYFYVPDSDAEDIGAKLVTQTVWYGSVRTPMTYGFIQELMNRAGFRQIRRCAFRLTTSRYPDIVSLDNRERESFFVEAIR